MMKRLPVSLKIDDDELYFGLIEPKKNDHELSNLILMLLKLYHTNEVVRKEADDFMVSKSPYLRIHEELQRIALEHSKQATTTGMLGDYTNNETKKLKRKQEQSVYEEPAGDEKDTEMNDIRKLLTDQQKENAEIKEQFKQMMALLTQGAQSVVIPPQVVSEPPKVVSVEPIVEPIIEVVESKPIVIPSTVDNVAQKSEDKAEEGAPKSKPASFSKLLKSAKM